MDIVLRGATTKFTFCQEEMLHFYNKGCIIYRLLLCIMGIVFIVLGGVIMANRYLLPVYKTLYERNFSYSEFDQRMEMQKAVYLLQDMGVPVGDYGFRWYLHGPYSQSLQDDMHYESGREVAALTLSKEYAESIGRLHDVIHSEKRGSYSVTNWVECLASLHYLRENLLDFNATEDEVVQELENRKKHLSNHDTNVAAYRLVEGLFH